MKKTILVLIIMAILTGIGLADHGIPPVPETQGIVTSTTIDAVGNFASTSEIQWRITDEPRTRPRTATGLSSMIRNLMLKLQARSAASGTSRR